MRRERSRAKCGRPFFGSLITALCVLGLSSTVEAAAGASYCSAGGRWGIGLCSGEIFLRAQYVEVGIHRVGSYGTTSNAPSAFQASKVWDKRLGFMADYDKNGWASGSPAYSGDYFVPGTPAEGWLVQSTVGSSTTLVVNKGLMTSSYGDNYYIRNYGAAGTMPMSAMHVTSDDERQSMFWVGQYGNLQVFFNVIFGQTDLFFTTSVTLRNVGNSQLKDVYYMRNVDPDQEQPHTRVFSTRNWVQYQPFKDGDPTGYVSDTDPNLALVLARGRTYADLLCGLGTSHPNARVSFYGFDNNNPVVAYAANSGTYGQWRDYGGTNVGPEDTGEQHYADEGINLAFYFATLDVGATAEFDFAYVLEASDLTVAMNNLKAIKILQPTDIISGTRVLISIQISEEIGAVDKIVYSMYMDTGSPQWYHLDTVEYESPEDALNVFSTTFNSLDYTETTADVHLKVEVYEKVTGKKYVKLKPTSINNVGPQMCFDVPNPENVEFYTGQIKSLTLIRCEGYIKALPTKVQFYREVYLLGNSFSELIRTDTYSGDGFTVDVSVDDLPKGLQIVVKAKSTLNSDVTTTTVTGTITEPNFAPSDITLSNPFVTENSVTNTAVGTFTVTDANTADSHVLTLIDSAGGRFALSGNNLVVNGDIDFESTPSLLIRVKADDKQAADCCLTKQFTINVVNVNEPPNPFTPTSINVAEDVTVGSTIASLSGSDPEGNSITFSVLGDTSRFNIEGNSLKLKKALDYESDQTHDITVRATDNGSPVEIRDQGLSINVVDVNEAPTSVTLNCVGGTCQVEENTPVDTVVGTLTAQDQDAGQTHTFSIVGESFFKVAGDQLLIKSNIDYEQTGVQISVTVTAQDNGSPMKSLTVTIPIIVLDVDEAPVVNQAICYVDEDRHIGDTVTSTTWNEICMIIGQTDDNTALTYSIPESEAPNTDGKFTVQDCSGLFFIAGDLDFETNPMYEFQVTVTGAGGSTTQGTATIYVVDVNEQPVLEAATVSIDENSEVGTEIIHELVTHDSDNSPSTPFCCDLDYEIVDGDTNPSTFTIEPATGRITLADTGVLNFEAVSQYVLTVRVTDEGGLWSTNTVTINVNDLNEAPVLTKVTGTFASVREDAATDDQVGVTIGAADQDVGTTLSFSIVAGDPAGAFKIVTEEKYGTQIGQLLVDNSTAIDFEAGFESEGQEFDLVVRVSDGELSDESTFKIKVIDVNEPPSLPTAFAWNIDENTAANTDVGTPLSASLVDPDAGDVHSYVITDFGGDDNTKTFAVSSTTGQMYVNKATLNYEVLDTYVYEVTATDSGGLNTVTTITISVNDLNEAPTFIAVNLASISEDSEVGALVAAAGDQALVLQAFDDDGDPLTFTIETAGVPFSVAAAEAPNTANLVLTSVLNYEAKASYPLTVKVSDGSLTASTTFTITVLDANDPPILNDKPCSLSENADAGVSVCTFSATDQDSTANIWGQHNYSMISAVYHGSGGDEDASAYFDVTFANNLGTLELMQDLEVGGTKRFEVERTIDVTVLVTDGGGLSDTAIATVTVTEVNAAPECTPGQIFTVPENSDVGVSVGTVLATDTNEGDVITATLVSGNIGGVFALDGSTREITVSKAALDFETMASYSLAISLEDQKFASSVCLITVNLIDENEPVTFEDQALIVDENIPAGPLTLSGSEVASIQASDPDADDQNPTYSIVLQGGRPESENPIEVNPATGQLSLKAGFSLNYEAKAHPFVYEMTWSSRTEIATAILTININDLPESPVVVASAFSVVETSTGAIGNANAIDPDFEGNVAFDTGEFCRDLCGLRYSIQSGAFGSFSIDINTGAISVTSNGLDYENRATYELTIKVVDQSGLGTSATGVVTITVTDVADCGVNNLFLDVSSSPVFGTAGAQQLRINGRDFGPTTTRTYEELTIAVNYRDKSSASQSVYRYDAINCHRDSAADLINADVYCDTVPGVGKNLGVVVTVTVVYNENETSVCTTPFSVPKLSYAVPTILAMQNHDNIPTPGGSSVTLTGNDFGPIASNNVVTARYGPTGSEYTSSCAVVTSHTKVVCTSVAGIGAGLSWVLQVAGQHSAAFGGSKYANPSITQVSGTMDMQTSGGEPITLTGTNFGSTSSVVTVTYGSATTPVYTAASCVVAVAHTEVRCRTVAGYGADLEWKLAVGGQTSAAAADTTSYLVPVIESVSGPGSFRANTEGGQIVLVAGLQFGPKYSSGEYDHIVVTYGPTGTEYTAASCTVSAPHTQLQCVTVPGTGKDHSWLVQIGGQTSALFGAMTSYSPPIVAYYLGAGSNDADTEGGQVVTVMGANFGNDPSMIDRVTYAAPNGTTFSATDCTIVVAHTTITCDTVPGAGENLHWVVTVDGQDSEAPATSYASPLLQTITGPGAVDADVYGGEAITLTGDYFGPPNAKDLYGVQFLQKVSYGEAGDEYQAQNCVVISHQEIRCVLAPGVGKDLRWSVQVAGQSSGLSLLTTNYKAPHITSISPTHYETAGGVAMTIEGSDFATFQMPTLLFNGVRQIPSYTPGDDKLLMTIPEGYGTNIQLQLIVGDQPSNIMTFDYDPPVITSVNTKAADNSTITLIIIGKSFSLEPTVTIELDGTVYQVYCPMRSHNQITCLTTLQAGYVRVNVHGTPSNERYFEYGEARVLYSNAEGGAVTDGGATLRLICQYCGEDSSVLTVEIGGRECTIKSYEYAEPSDGSYSGYLAFVDRSAGYDEDVALQEVVCTVPEGEGVRNSIIITRNDLPSLGCGCEECAEVACFDYLPPTVNSMSANSADTDSKLQVLITGDNFGINPEVLVGPAGSSAKAVLRGLVMSSLETAEPETQSWTILNSTHHEVIVEVAEYEGKDLTMTMSVANQTFSIANAFSYNPPVIDSSNNAKLVAGTEGSNHTITITGKNFGVLGPQLFLGGVEQHVSDYSHHTVEFMAPPGVGKDLSLVIIVGGQYSVPEDPNNPIVFSYDVPEIFDVWPSDLTSDTKGGFLSDPQVIVTVVGDNFGLQSMSWSLTLKGQTASETDVPVTDDDIVHWNHTHILFYVPEGQGENKKLVLVVGEQEALSSEEYFFSYTPPQVYNILPIADPNTDGGYTMTINGTSFGVQGASVILGDPLANSSNERMPGTPCEILLQSHERVECKVPRGVGANLHATLTVDSRSDWAIFSYSPPVIDFFLQSRGGDAAGGETLKVYGTNLGPWRTPAKIMLDDVECPNSEWLADDRLNSFQPYLNCPFTPKTTAGLKNVTVQVAYQESAPNGQFQVECKRGFFGGDGEFCVDCGNPDSTGFVCDVDNLYLPVSAPGWWRIMEPQGSSYCPQPVRQRVECPSMWPCEPSEACLGNNTCNKKYDPTSERCSECADGYFRLNEECRKCPDQPWVIVLTAVIVLGAGGYVAQKLNKKRVNLGILSIGVDFFQVLAIFSTTTEWPSEMVDLYNTLSAFNLNIDLSAPECWDAVSFSYKEKWIVIECFPLFLMTLALIVYFSKYAYKRFIKRRRARLQSHLPALIGFVFTFMYYIYLYITTTTLAVFNCQPTEPSDGNRYMAAVGTSGGICYKEGSMQQELEPWAILAFIVYVIGFPVLVGTILFRSKTTAVRDQLLRAARKGPREVKAAGTYAFRKRYHRLYFQFKPQYFFWILLILARKFVLGVAALLFRDNVTFLLSMTLLTMFIAYALEVRFQPYMSTADYDKIAADNADALNQILTAEMIRINAEQMRKLHKKTRIDDFSDLSRFRPQMTYFHDYNVVESVLLFAIVLVNLSGIMFESGQLGKIQTKTLTYVIILIVAASIAYFAWVLFSEVWIAFYPDKPLFGMKLEIIKEEEDPLKDEDIQFEFANPDMLVRQNSSDMEAEMLSKDTSLAKQEELIRQQKDEITKLKRELSSKPGISGKPTVVKKKKDFATASTEAAAAPADAIQLVRFGSDGNDTNDSRSDRSNSLDVL